MASLKESTRTWPVLWLKKKEEERVFLVFGKVRLKEQEHKNIANELIKKKKKPFGILEKLRKARQRRPLNVYILLNLYYTVLIG